jgi:hypothetical protein
MLYVVIIFRLPVMQCKQCDRPFDNDERIASISGSIMGDEVTNAYFLCPVCGMYTVVQWWHDFTGVETMSLTGPCQSRKGIGGSSSSGSARSPGTGSAAAMPTAPISTTRWTDIRGLPQTILEVGVCLWLY